MYRQEFILFEIISVFGWELFSLSKCRRKSFPPRARQKWRRIQSAHKINKCEKKGVKNWWPPRWHLSIVVSVTLKEAKKQNIGVTKTAYALFLVFSQVGFQLKTLNQIYPAFFSFESSSIKKYNQSLSSLIEMVKIKMDAEGKVGNSGHVCRPHTNC